MHQGDMNSDGPIADSGTAADPGVADREESGQVDLQDEAQVEHWTERLSVTRAQLEEAVSAVGEDGHAVETYLRGQGGGD